MLALHFTARPILAVRSLPSGTTVPLCGHSLCPSLLSASVCMSLAYECAVAVSAPVVVLVGGPLVAAFVGASRLEGLEVHRSRCELGVAHCAGQIEEVDQ